MLSLCNYAGRPVAFLLRYVRRRPLAHGAILLAVLSAVGCSVSTQYAVKFLVDTLDRGRLNPGIWTAFVVLVSLVAADNLLWRLGGWVSSHAFVGVSGDLRGELFRHLTGHAPSYFSERLAGTLTGRITATSNAAFAVENLFMWNVLPPCVATTGAIAYLASVSIPMAAVLTSIAAVLIVVLFKLAAAGAPLHHGFADKAARVEGELADVIGNMPLVRTFGATTREHVRFDETVGQEMTARRKSLLYLERLRLLHAAVTIVLTVAMLAWAIVLWQRGGASSGDVVLVCTLGFTILHSTRDLAVALVDVTQHMARLSEAIATLLQPHQLRDHPEATPLEPKDRGIEFEGVSFAYPGGDKVFDRLDLHFEAGKRTGLVGPSGGGKSTILSLLQRFYDVDRGRILIDGQDISRITQDSMRRAISFVPQDISLLHRSVFDNIRYGKPEATETEVRKAAEAACCRDFIEALPMGFDTVVGDRGARLSGGQRQRIAIARALLKDSPILLLDEATSSLDSESEEAIRQALDHLMQGRTVIAIAHRLSTLRNFDRIVVLQEGQVIQEGTPDELLHRRGPYRMLIDDELARLTRRAAA
ncbi:ABC transporter ATP-binding protein [Reyranella sp.]|jgi:ATP-binding cassette subfamily B protein|uniref:ABC transporter ATP-binding protein n=1 Tax=Reyranella sp. TaxID=1929291 RepID=UPI002F93052B